MLIGILGHLGDPWAPLRDPRGFPEAESPRPRSLGDSSLGTPARPLGIPEGRTQTYLWRHINMYVAPDMFLFYLQYSCGTCNFLAKECGVTNVSGGASVPYRQCIRTASVQHTYRIRAASVPHMYRIRPASVPHPYRIRTTSVPKPYLGITWFA